MPEAPGVGAGSVVGLGTGVGASVAGAVDGEDVAGAAVATSGGAEAGGDAVDVQPPATRLASKSGRITARRFIVGLLFMRRACCK